MPPFDDGCCFSLCFVDVACFCVQDCLCLLTRERLSFETWRAADGVYVVLKPQMSFQKVNAVEQVDECFFVEMSVSARFSGPK